MKVLISGGHPSPALAVIDTLRQTHPTVEIAFIGREVAQHTTGQLAGEREAIEQRGIPFYPIYTAKWGKTIWQRIVTFGLVSWATITTYRLLQIIQPTIFLSFGSYVAVPVAIACSLRGIPVITHEQTRVAGISNRFIAKWATVVALAYPESARFFPTYKTIVTGLPLRPQLFLSNQDPPAWAETDFLHDTAPILYVTGGSTGSHTINALITQLLPTLVQEWRVVHPCGRATEQVQWLRQLQKVAERLPTALRARYVVTEQLSVNDLRWIYQQNTVVLGRAGANTAAEVTVFDLPAIFIPLPQSNFDEQAANAQALVDTGKAIMINQNDLSPENVQQALEKFRPEVVRPAKKRTPPITNTATTKLIQVVLETSTKNNAC